MKEVKQLQLYFYTVITIKLSNLIINKRIVHSAVYSDWLWRSSADNITP